MYKNKKSGLVYIPVAEADATLNGMDYTVVSLFSGAGGLDIGLEQAGFRTIVCIDNDPNCRATLKYNRPDWIVFDSPVKVSEGQMIQRQPGDIRDIEPEEVLQLCGLPKGKVALVVGGAPCQPFSNIGKKEGHLDAKNGDLFLEFVRMVNGIQPYAFIFENVAGITQSKHNQVIEYMLSQFRDSGYGLSYGLVNAANYGVPQRRERFILLGLKGVKEPAFPLPTHFKDQKSWDSFAADLSPCPVISPQKWVTVREAFVQIPDGYKERPDYAVMNISPLVKKRMQYIEQGQNFKVLPLDMRPECWRTGKHQGNDTFGRMVADYPSVTIRTAAYNPAKGMYIHPFEDRGLDTIEMAVLQGFPLEWEYRTTANKRVTLISGGKQIGNAVPPGLAKALGLAVRKQISATLTSQKKPLMQHT